MRLVSHFTKFVFPFLYGPMARREITHRLLSGQRWRPRIFDVSVAERHHPAKTADELRTEYFLPHVRRYLFPTTACTRSQLDMLTNLERGYSFEHLASSLDGFPVLYFSFDLDSLGTAEAGRPVSVFNCIRGGQLLATANLTAVDLQLLEHEIAFLTLRMQLSASSDPVTLEQLMDFNYETRSVEAFHSAHSTIDLELAGRHWKPIQFINYLLGELDETQQPTDVTRALEHARQLDRLHGVREMYDDRALVYSFACVAAQETWEHPGNAQLREGFLALRRSSTTDQLDPAYATALGERYRFSRWMYSRFSFGKEGGCFVGSAAYPTNERDQPRYFGEYYFDVFIFALYQRLVALQISERLASIRALPRSVRSVQRIREQLLEFTNRCWFGQVTTRQQGQEIFERWQAALEVRALFAEVQGKLKEIDDALASRATSKRDRLLVVVTILFLPTTVVAGILGMNVADFGAGTVNLRMVWRNGAWLIVGFPLLVLLVAFWDTLAAIGAELRERVRVRVRRWRARLAAHLARR